MSSDTPRDPLLDAALAASDGRVGADAKSLDGDQQRVMANLHRLAGLKNSFAGTVGADAEKADEDGTAMPAQWGHLRIVAEIGRGSFGIVYRAFDPVLQREVALKLRPNGDRSPQDAAGYIDEARRLARVRHPNVLAVHGADVSDGRVGLWSDLLEGKTLEQVLHAQGTLDATTIRQIARQLAAALTAIHEARLVHGDIKASNVMHCDEQVVLMDFGAGGEIGRRPRYGSPASMAPELWRGETASAASDVYSLGAMLHQLATGELPGRGNPDKSTMLHAQTLTIRRLRKKLGSPTGRLIETMLAPDPQRRPSAQSVGAQLGHIESLPRRRRQWAAQAAVILSLAAGLVASLIGLQRVREAQRGAEALTNFIVDSVHNIAPESQHGPATLTSLFRYMGAHAERELSGFPQALARVWLVIGQGMVQSGQLQNGLQLARRGTQWLDRHAPNMLSDRAGAHDVLAKLLQKDRQPVAAEREARLSLALFMQLPASDERTLQVIRVRTLLGNVLTDSGHWREGAAAHRRILADRTRLLGANSPALAVDYYNLGNVLQRLNQVEQARRAYRRAAKLIPSPRSGVPDVHALYVQQGLAACELNLGHLQRARNMLQQIRQGYLQHYPADHVTVLHASALLAEVERRAGHPGKALDMMRALPAKTFDAANARLLLVHVLIDNARYDEARNAAVPLDARFRRSHDPRKPYVPALLRWLDYRLGGDPGAARAAIDKALSAMRADGYDGLREATELTTWRAVLTAQSPGSS